MSLELRQQANYSQWFWNTYPEYRGRLRRIKNELDNHPYKKKIDIMKQLSENKATGIIPGDSDFYFIGKKITYIEIKTETGTQSKEQMVFEGMVTMYGHNYVIVRSLDEFQNLIVNLLNGRV